LALHQLRRSRPSYGTERNSGHATRQVQQSSHSSSHCRGFAGRGLICARALVLTGPSLSLSPKSCTPQYSARPTTRITGSLPKGHEILELREWQGSWPLGMDFPMVNPAFEKTLILSCLLWVLKDFSFGLTLDLSASMCPFLCYDSRNSRISRHFGRLCLKLILFH